MLKYKLNDWAIVSAASPYSAPEFSRLCLMGKVEGHPERDDGTTIVSSRVIGKFEGRVVTSTGSLIELGEPREAYEQAFNDSKRRLFESLNECILRWDGSIR